jgi:CheY-like chemotaxis protein
MHSSQPTAALIVEGQPFVGLVASDILRETGFETFHASDGADAIALLRSHPEIEVVITEADLGGSMNGLELSRRVSAERPDIQLVVTCSSAELPSSDLPPGTRLLRKPYASAELRQLVDRMTLLDA